MKEELKQILERQQFSLDKLMDIIRDQDAPALMNAAISYMFHVRTALFLLRTDEENEEQKLKDLGIE